MIHAWGQDEKIAELIERLNDAPPPLARIDGIQCMRLEASVSRMPEDFRILSSQTGSIQTAVAADAATCPACLHEVMDRNDRRYRYPFSNCTHCGPRLSIIRAVPYDRANTSMACFQMCPACEQEYGDPGNRRFHAQPNACSDCGPTLSLVDSQGAGAALKPDDVDAIAAAARLLAEGAVVAIKGIGGFHLACNAGNEQAVARLRQRKHRYDKPFAVMVQDMSMLRQYALADDQEQRLLESRAAPIVILKAQGKHLASGIAPHDPNLGMLLPYTPLHHCLLQDIQEPIVLTSGNRSDEPQYIDNDRALQRLAGIADFWLMHDRDIVNRLDDSVLRVMDGKPHMIRRARGYAPEAIVLDGDFASAEPVLAMGAELKNTFCLLARGEAIVSQHMGDLENPQVQSDYRSTLARYRKLFDRDPAHIVVDLHPDYLSTQLGQQLAAEGNLTLHQVQHHHAHIAACMAEHGLPLDTEPVLGLAFDGLGYAQGGAFWGGISVLRLSAIHPPGQSAGNAHARRTSGDAGTLAQYLCTSGPLFRLAAMPPPLCRPGHRAVLERQAAENTGCDAGRKDQLSFHFFLRAQLRCLCRGTGPLPRPHQLRRPGGDSPGSTGGTGLSPAAGSLSRGYA